MKKKSVTKKWVTPVENIADMISKKRTELNDRYADYEGKIEDLDQLEMEWEDQLEMVEDKAMDLETAEDELRCIEARIMKIVNPPKSKSKKL